MRMLTSLLCRRSTPKLRFNCGTIPRQYTFSTATGLYGFEHLKFPKGFQRLADDAIERSAELVEHIAMSSSVEVIRAIDEISDTVSTVFDSAELCRNTHPDRKFVEEATKASIRMRQYLHCLNTNHTLYHAVKKAEQEGHLLTHEAQRLARCLCRDSEKGGIHLSADKLDRVNWLDIEISQLCRQFNENIVTDPGAVDIFPASRIPQKLHHLLKPIYHSTSVISTESLRPRGTMKEKGFRITTDPHTLSCVLQGVPDAEVRKMTYIKGNSVPLANLDVLEKLIAARHELAQIMGCRSYAEFSLKSSIASSPEVVMSFLREMSKMVRPSADEEFKKIKDFKRGVCGEQYEDLEPWDEEYYTALMKSSAYDMDSLVVASYFPLPQCIEGLKVLVESLFGATLHSIPLAPGESWHPDVLKMSLHHPEEGDLGYLYLDMYSRKGKYPDCAHFAIKAGRRVSETEYQLPAVAIVCSFSALGNSSMVRLNHWELETLFHEFGHALHSLLSRTDYQNFSGSRVAFDFAETPSTLFEYYSLDYRVLRRFAKHYSTGEIIPEALVASMQGARKMFAATDLQRQTFYAAVGQTFFGEQPTPPTSSIVADLKREYTSWKHVEGTHWHTRYNHLVNYGAGYYSYLYAKCFAATIWQKLCEEDPLSLATGSALRLKLLQYGGAKEAAELLNGLVGGGGGDGIIVRDCDGGGRVPNTTCLCTEMNTLRNQLMNVV
ncbi:hypothetical protein ACFX12_023551 [Malus domestica]